MFLVETNRSSKKTIDRIIITYNEKVIKFTGRAAIKLEKDIEANLFDCFNEYVNSILDKDQKLALFDLFFEANTVVNSGKFSDYKTEVSKLIPIVENIYKIINQEKYVSFIQYSRHLVIPKNLTLPSTRGEYPEETTINESHYADIVKTTFMIRVVYPIIFGLLYRFDALLGSEYAEYYTGILIKDNQYIKSMAGWIKLVTYFRSSFGKRGVPSQSLDVTSMEFYVEKIIFKTIFTRLCCAVIPETDEERNIANLISGVVKQSESSNNIYRKKEASGGDDEDGRSIYEKYQIAEEVNSADEETMAEYFSFGLFDETEKERRTNRFHYQCKGFGIKQEALVERVYDNFPTTWDFDLGQHIVKLLQLTFMGEISPPVYEACDYTQLLCAIALAQVKLTEEGYKHLPSVLGAIHDPNGNRTVLDVVRLSTEDREELESICNIQAKNTDERSSNEAVIAATQFLDTFGNGIWQSNLEIGVLDEPEVYQRVKKGMLFPLEITKDIKNEFMHLVMNRNTL